MAGILNYTTKISPEKTVGEIGVLLARKGVLSVGHIFTEGKLSGFTFTLPIGGHPTNFQLPVNVDGVQKFMLAGKRNPTAAQKKSIADQAPRTAWRIMLNWIEAQLALVESKQAEMGQVFMPFALSPGGQTVYSLVMEHGNKYLTSGGDAELPLLLT